MVLELGAEALLLLLWPEESCSFQGLGFLVHHQKVSVDALHPSLVHHQQASGHVLLPSLVHPQQVSVDALYPFLVWINKQQIPWLSKALPIWSLAHFVIQC